MGDLRAANGGHLLDMIDVEQAIEQALSDRKLARAVEKAHRTEAARRAATSSGVRTGPPAEPLLTRTDMAKLLQCSVRTVQRLEATGRLRRCGGLVRLVRFERAEVQRFLAEREVVAS